MSVIPKCDSRATRASAATLRLLYLALVLSASKVSAVRPEAPRMNLGVSNFFRPITAQLSFESFAK